MIECFLYIVFVISGSDLLLNYQHLTNVGSFIAEFLFTIFVMKKKLFFLPFLMN